ncbi:hypothetical protein D3C87_2125770 [compost metagenome]
MSLEILVLAIYRELEARVSSFVPAEGKDLARIRSAARCAPSDVTILADFVIIGGMASTPLQ